MYNNPKGSYNFVNLSKTVKNLKVMETLLEEYMQGNNIWFNDWCIDCMASQSPTHRIYRCSACHLVSYCDRNCQKRDWPNHKYVCREFPVVNGRNVLYTTGPWGKHLAELRKRAAELPKAEIALNIFQNPRVCHNCWEAGSEKMKYCMCTCVSYCSETCANADTSHKNTCKRLRFALCRSYPMSIFNALHEVTASLHQGSDKCSIHDMDTLTIHIIDRSPIFDSRVWGDFKVSFPKLKKLNVVFVIQHKYLQGWFILNSPPVMVNTCTIAYSIQQMKYHMFFSSNDYTEPDVVVVFGSTYEMDLNFGDNDVHSEISYRNMLYCPETILILMDESEEALSIEVKYVNTVQPVVQLVPPQVNPLKEAVSDEEPDINSESDFLNERLYFTCLRRK